MIDLNALWVTLQLAAATTAILFVLGVPAAYLLARKNFRGKFLLETFLTLPLVLPPTVIGFYLLIATGPHGPFGDSVYRWLGVQIPFSFVGILLGSVLCNIPFAMRSFIVAMESVDRHWIEASWCLGESKWNTFWRITVPCSWPGIVAGMMITFAHTFGEFGVVLMIGGSIPGVTRTLSIALYDEVQSMNYSAAHGTAATMLVLSFFILALAQFLTAKSIMR